MSVVCLLVGYESVLFVVFSCKKEYRVTGTVIKKHDFLRMKSTNTTQRQHTRHTQTDNT